MSEVTTIEVPVIEATVDPTDKLLADALADKGMAPGDEFTMEEIHRFEAGEADPALLERMEAYMAREADAADKLADAGAAAAASEKNPPDANGVDSIAANNDLQALQSQQASAAPVELPPVIRDWQAEGAKLDTEVATLRDELKLLVKQVEDGDLLESEVIDKRLELEAKLNGLAADQRFLQREQQDFAAYQDRQLKAWQQECRTFVSVTNKGFYSGEDGKPNMERIEDLDSVVKSTAKANPNLTDSQVLAKAHEKVMRMHGVAPQAKAEETPPPAAKNNPPAPKLPPVLGNLPQSESVDAGNKWAQLDNAKGDPLIDTIRGMSQAQIDAYLANA